MITVALVLLAIAGALFVYRLLQGPSLATRIVALDGLLVTVVAAITVNAARTDSDVFLGAVLVVALVGFVATSAVARFIERRGG